MELKNFVDFAYSLVNMDEVKDGIFKIPKEIIYELDIDTHRRIHKEIKENKDSKDVVDLDGDFTIQVFNITFNFKQPVEDVKPNQ